jgi:hypothetical protein
LDWTGYGPTGTGGAPTAREIQQQFRNQHMTARMAQAAAMIDPVALATTYRITQGLVAKSSDPEQLRRAMFNSAAGQAAQDAAMYARRTGILGQGDPVTAAANIAQGVAGGGFRMSAGGSMGTGVGMPVSGTGPVAEHVSMSFMKKIMSDMYGNTGDTSRMHGFNSEQVSEVFKTLAQRGGIGQIAHLQTGASLQTRLDAARANAIDPSQRAGLDKLSITEGVNEAQQAENLQKMADASGDKKLSTTVKALIQSPAALITNKQEVDRVGQVVKDITASLTGLADLYENLSPKELQRKLEQVSGMKITNRGQAVQAAAQVSQLRGAAVAAGMDPRAFMDWSGDMQAQLRGEVASAIGADGRHGSIVAGITAPMNNRMMVDSAFAAQQASRAVMQGRKLGVDLDDAPTMDEIYEDKKQGRTQFLQRYTGVTMAMGGMDNFKGPIRKDAEALLKKFQGTTNAGERTVIEEQMQALWAANSSSPGDERSFEAVLASRTAKLALKRAYSNPWAAREMERMAAEGRRDAIDINPLIRGLDVDGISDAKGVGNSMLKNLGASGMGAMLQISETDMALDGKGEKSDKPLTGANRVQMLNNELARAGITGEAADKFRNQFFDKDGRMKEGSKAGYTQAMQHIIAADYEPGLSTYDQAGIGAARLAAVGADGMRKKMSDADGRISLGSIATMLVTGGMKTGISDPESMVLAMEALAGAGPVGPDGKPKGIPIPQLLDKTGKGVDAKSQYAAGIDFSKGLTTEGMKELSRIYGKDLDLHKKVSKNAAGDKFGSMGDLIEATKGPGGEQLTTDAIEMMQIAFPEINLRGTANSMTAITDSGKEAFQNSGEVPKMMKRHAANKIIASAMGLDPAYTTSLDDALAKGETPNLGMFAVDKFDKTKVKDGVVTLGEGFDRTLKLSGRIGSASKAEMAALATQNEGGEMTRALEASREELQKSLPSAKTAAFKNAEGNQRSAESELLIKQLDAAIKKLADQSVADGTQAKTIYVKGDIVVDGGVRKHVPD